jgi:hypothetical protein
MNKEHAQYKYLSVVLALTLLLSCSKTFAIDGNTPLHVVASAGLTAASYVMLSGMLGRGEDIKPAALGMAVGLSTLVGLGKEVMDTEQTGGKWTPNNTEDMVANAIGNAISAYIIYRLDFNLDKETVLSDGRKLYFGRRF